MIRFTHKFGMIIGLHGKAGSGKDTIAERLARLSRGEWRIFHFAAPLKEVAMEIYGLTRDQVYDRELKEIVIPRLGKSPRQILQYLGTDVLREKLGPQVFVNAIRQRIDSAFADGVKLIIIPDVRFPNERDMILGLGGIVIKVTRPDNLRLGTMFTDHVTETELPDESVTDVFLNNGDMDKLERDVAILAQELMLDS